MECVSQARPRVTAAKRVFAIRTFLHFHTISGNRPGSVGGGARAPMRLMLALAATPLGHAALPRLAVRTALHVTAARQPLSLGSRRAARQPLMSLSAGSPEEQIKRTVAENKVVIFSKTYCGFSGRTKALFDELGVPFTAVEFDEVPNGAELQQALTELSGQRTVPNVFINGKHLGGNDDTQRAYRSGQLGMLLEGE